MTVSTIYGPSPASGASRPSWKPAEGAALTEHQVDVLRRIAEGQSWREIGVGLGLTVGGVGSVNKQILLKLGARSSAHAVLLACQAGLLDGKPQRHGDHAGFRAHERRGEDPWACEPCTAGERAYRAGRRQGHVAA